MNLLPFNFNRISDNRFFISNLAGFSSVIDESSLNELIDHGKTKNSDINRGLEEKFFISDDLFTAEKVLAAALGKKWPQK